MLLLPVPDEVPADCLQPPGRQSACASGAQLRDGLPLALPYVLVTFVLIMNRVFSKTVLKHVNVSQIYKGTS